MRSINKLYLLILCLIILNSFCGLAWADSLTPQPLALSSEEIVKLNHYFPANNFSSVRDNDFNSTIPAHIVWDGETPIVIILPVGKERIIHFPSQVQFGYDRSLLPSNLLQVQNNNETLYLTAYQAFPTQRVKVKLVNSGKIIYLDLSAKNQGASDIPLDVVIQNPEENFLSSTQKNLEETNISYLTLTRFAAQQLYAPERLITEAPAAIYRTPMHTARTVPLLLDGSVIAMPLASWRGGDLTVTAVLLRNQLQQSLSLDPRQLCGDWRAATFFPQNQLSKSGDPRDTTTVFLVSDSSFGDAINPCEGGVK